MIRPVITLLVWGQIFAIASSSFAQDAEAGETSISLEGWPSETFDLPPSFAPDLPTGTESLLFSPGWRDPDAEGFWSYTFVMWIDEPAPGATRVEELLESYYTGLMSVFAGNRDKVIADDPVRVEVAHTAPQHFEAKMHLIDAFATFEPIDLRVLIETAAQSEKRSSVRIQVSQQPQEHEIWRSLAFANQTIVTPSEASVSLEPLRDRAQYAELDKPTVEAMARAAESQWPQEFSGFSFQGVERFSAAGVSHWMSIWLHRKTGLEFVLAPGGSFQMGSPASEANRHENERQHWVTLDPFLISRTECTQSAWAKVALAAGMDNAPSAFEGSDQLPVESVNLETVEAWCGEALLAVPTEAQWEYACRGGTTSPWAMGPLKTDLKEYANVGSLDCPKEWVEHELGITEPWHDGYGDQLAEVGSFSSNAFGLFDVHGNVWEWCRDHSMGYEVPVEAGTGLRPGRSGIRLARGGCFNNAAKAARSAQRFRCASHTRRFIGFRPSLDLPF